MESTQHQTDPRNRSPKAQEKKTFRALRRILFAAVLLVFVYSGYRVIAQLCTERAGKEVYAALDTYMQVEQDSTGGKEYSSETDTDDIAKLQSEEEGDDPAILVDTAALKEVNPDFAAVLYVPALGLLYPVAYSSDNNEYLTRTFDGTDNPCGSIFVDCSASRNFTDLHTLIFGHNMKNGTMFGSLKKFFQDPSLVEQDPYFYLYTEDRVLRYRIYAYLTLPVDDPIYSTAVDSAEDYDTLVRRLESASAYTPENGEVDYSGHPDLVTLSTCYGTGHTDNFVTCGVLVGEKANAAP